MRSPAAAGDPVDVEAADVEAVRDVLLRWGAGATQPAPDQERLRRRYLDHLAVPGALRKGGAADHLTASTLVLDRTGSSTLLVLHGRGGFWVQPGGHLEPGDLGTRGGAARELREETGLSASSVVVSELPADLDHHVLGTGFGRCRSHLDVAHLVVADPSAPVRATAESDDVAWWPLDALPDGRDGGPGVVGDLPPRLARAARSLRTG